MLSFSIRFPSLLICLILVIFVTAGCKSGSTPGNQGEDKDVISIVPEEEFSLISVNGQLWRTDDDGDAALVKHINTTGDLSAFPTEVESIVLNHHAYFPASDGNHGKELWSFDGVEPLLVKDINPGSANSYPSNLIVMGSTLYFLAATHASGQELWRSDGTEGGTWQVKEFRQGFEDGVANPPSIRDNTMVAADTRLYILAESDEQGRQLWVSDGTNTGTQWVADLNPDDEHEMIPAGNDLYLLTYTSSGLILQYIDGTTKETTLLKDLGIGDSSSTAAVIMDDQLYLLLEYDTQLWRSDGTTDGTVLFSLPGKRCGVEDPPAVLNSVLYFVIHDSENGCQLWRSDGTYEGTRPVQDISPAGYDGYSFESVAVMNSTLYFATESGGNGSQLWKSDGTTEGTVMIQDAAGDLAGMNLSSLTVVGNLLYFTASNWKDQGQLWRTDGGVNAATLIRSFDDSYLGRRHHDIFALGSILYFVAEDAVIGYELWKSDGTEQGTQAVGNINQARRPSFPSVALSGNIQAHASHNNIHYFTADDGLHGRELWRSDGTAEGTRLVEDIREGELSSGPQELTSAGSLIYFRIDGNSSSELWRSDGTDSGTLPIRTAQGAPIEEVAHLTAMNGVLYFMAIDNAFNSQLWRSDGTDEGTYAITGTGSHADVIVDMSDMMVYDSILYFAGWDEAHGEELWRSDGTEAGTYRVSDTHTGEGSSYPRPLGVLGTHLYVSASDGVQGEELWRTDGTPGGIQLVKDINVGASGSSPESLSVLDSTAYFIAYTDGYALWRTDGTEAGTYAVTDITSSHGSTAVLGGWVYFIGNTVEHGAELWRTDGTAIGTELVLDIIQGEQSTSPGYFTVIGQKLYFLAESYYNPGNMTWVSDGTMKGTHLVE